MNKLTCFNGAISAALTRDGYDSGKVLSAVNAVICGIEARADKTKVVTKATLAGKETEKHGDKRTVTIRESERRQSAAIAYSPQLALYALSSACDQMTDRHGVSLEIGEFPPAIALWLSRDSFRVNRPAAIGEPVEA